MGGLTGLRDSTYTVIHCSKPILQGSVGQDSSSCRDHHNDWTHHQAQEYSEQIII